MGVERVQRVEVEGDKTCPRRMNEMGPWDYEEGLDAWERRGGEEFLRCSFCGGIRPEDVIELVKGGQRVEPTDKRYKFYLTQGIDHTSIGSSGGAMKVYIQHFSEDQRVEFSELLAYGDK